MLKKHTTQSSLILKAVTFPIWKPAISGDLMGYTPLPIQPLTSWLDFTRLSSSESASVPWPKGQRKQNETLQQKQTKRTPSNLLRSPDCAFCCCESNLGRERLVQLPLPRAMEAGSQTAAGRNVASWWPALGSAQWFSYTALDYLLLENDFRCQPRPPHRQGQGPMWSEPSLKWGSLRGL